MEIKVLHDYEAMSAAAAEFIIDFVKQKPTAVLCFATGDTPKLTYQLVAEIASAEKVDFSSCSFVALDEWIGIPPDNSGSCRYFLTNYLLKPLKVQSSQVFLFDALTKDEQGECDRMNSAIEKKGGIDLMVVGVGMNGHIGFNEPGTDPESAAHIAVLDETTQTVGKKYFVEEVPIGKGITLGLKNVMEARTLLMIANGKKKAPVIRQAVELEITNQFPASLVRNHSNSILMIDKEAASELQIAAQ